MRKIRLLKDIVNFDIRDFAPELAKLAKARRLDLLYLFGGVAKGQAGKLSDLDFAYYSAGGVDQLTLQNDFARLLKRDDIDLVDLKFSPPLLAYKAIKEGRLLYCQNEALRVQMEYLITFKYLSTIHLRKEFHRYFTKTIREGNFYAQT